MGLDCSHGAWYGAYSAFHTWRCKIAELAGLPPLELMEGFFVPADSPYGDLPTLYYGPETRKQAYNDMPGNYLYNIEKRLPIKWDCLKPSPLHELLYHSDCSGELSPKSCANIANSLEALLPLMPENDVPGHIGNWRDKTETFIKGLRLAAKRNEPLVFG